MALLWAESMDKYDPAVDADLYNDNFNWSGTVDAEMIASVGRFGGNALEIDTRFITPPLRIPFDAVTSDTTIFVGMAFRYECTDSDSGNVFGFLEMYTTATAGSQHFSLAVTPAGGLLMFPASGNGFNVANCFYHRVWHWLELKVVLLDAGSFEVKIDGVTVLSGSGDFRSGTGNTSALGFIRINGMDLTGSNASVRYSDLIIQDSLGSAPYNTFLGDLRLENTIPNADGAVAAWTPLSGTNVSNIDDALAAYDDDTTYISSAVTDQVNLAGHVDHVLSAANTIHFAKLSALARNDGSNNVALRVVSGATGNDGATVTLGLTYKWCNKFWELDPNTAAAWTLANINAAEWGVKAKA